MINEQPQSSLAVIQDIAAYIADIPMLVSALRSSWRRWHWGLWLAGTLFAILIENYWIADEIYPYLGP